MMLTTILMMTHLSVFMIIIDIKKMIRYSVIYIYIYESGGGWYVNLKHIRYR